MRSLDQQSAHHLVKKSPFAHLAWLLFGSCLFAGCGRTTESLDRYSLSGKVEHAGMPVPFGEIEFQPDSAKGNNGPGFSASIAQGAYSVDSTHGSIGGPHLVTIRGFDGPPGAIGGAPPPGAATTANGKPLFPEHRSEVDLPREAATVDFKVP